MITFLLSITVYCTLTTLRSDIYQATVLPKFPSHSPTMMFESMIVTISFNVKHLLEGF
jgi:hypothetical protein